MVVQAQPTSPKGYELTVHASPSSYVSEAAAYRWYTRSLSSQRKYLTVDGFAQHTGDATMLCLSST
jgi:hypothetical protein